MKTKKNQDIERSSSETDTSVTRIVDKTDPEIMNKVVDRSEQETEEALRTVGQTISKQMPSISRDATNKILNELKNVIQERRDRRKTGRNEEGQVDGEREERREEGDAVKNDQWYDVLDFGITTERRTGVSIRSTILRMDRLGGLDEQGSTNVPEVLATSGGKTSEKMRRELERREDKDSAH